MNKKYKIAVWAPSSPATVAFPNRFQRAIDNMTNDNSVELVIGQSCYTGINFHEDYQEEIIEELYQFVKDSTIDIIMFATGGWTSVTLLNQINWDLLIKYPKKIVGYSDATPFLLAYYRKTSYETYHGPMLLSEWGELGGAWNYTQENFWRGITSSEIKLFPPEYWTEEVLYWDKEDNRRRSISGVGNWQFIKGGKSEGTLIGGNLTTMMMILDTEYMPDSQNAILFIEDDGVALDQFIAYLHVLKLRGIFNNISGLIVGRIARPIAAVNGNNDFQQAIKNVLKDIDIPVLVDVDIGHTEPMLTLPIGRKVRLDSSVNEWIVLSK